MPIGKACQQPAFTVSDVRRSQLTTRNTSIKSRDAQDPVPILVTGRNVSSAPNERDRASQTVDASSGVIRIGRPVMRSVCLLTAVVERRGAEARKHVNADDGAECLDELAGGGWRDVRQVDFGQRR